MLLALSFTQSAAVNPNLLALSFVQRGRIFESLLGLSFAHSRIMPNGLLALSFGGRNVAQRFQFKGSQTQGFGDFNLRVYIDGKLAPMCDFAETMTIERAEDESSLCEFILRPARERKNPRPIDLFQWYCKEIVVDVVSATQIVRLFRGFVDKVDCTLLAGRIALRCADRREQALNALPPAYVQSIGYTSKSAHGNEFDSLKDELNARLPTIPYSLELDLDGTPHLTAWQPKSVADYVLSPCVIYQREPSLELAEVGGVVTVAEIELNLSFPRLIQRKINLSFQSGLNVCQYARYGKLASVEDFAQAIGQTGWGLGSFDVERVEPSGWYRCAQGMVGFMRDSRTFGDVKTDENGTESNHARDVGSVSRVVNLDVKNGNFVLMRRWQQAIKQVFCLNLSSPTAAQFGKNVQRFSFSVSESLPENVSWETPNPHEKKLKYEYDHGRIWHHHIETGDLPREYAWQHSASGDVWTDCVDWAEFERTAQVAYHTAYTKILQTHRNSLNLEVKFMPFASLRHTHEIRHSHFSGRAKVRQIKHHFDFEKGLGRTELRYGFFYGNAEKLTPYAALPKEIVPTGVFENDMILGKVELLPDETLDDARHIGLIYRRSSGWLLHLEKLNVRTPEIEEDSTATRELTYHYDKSIDVYRGDVEMRL